MKYLLVLLIIASCIIAEAQSVSFQLQRITPCNSSPTVDSFDYYLTDNLSNTSYSLPYGKETGTLILPRPGKYTIHTYDIDPETTKEIEIPDTGLFIYKIIEPKIVLRTYNVLHPPSLYEICGHIIEGYAEDFYPNGNLRIRGNFSKGKPKDSLVLFYSNGALKTRVRFPLNELIIENYDSLNHLLRIRTGNNYNPYFTPGKDVHYQITDYFTTGKIKRTESKEGYIIIFKEYYSNGVLKIEQTKNFSKEYYENGRRKTVCVWERKKDTTTDSYNFIITRVVFNKSGGILEKQVFEQWESDNNLYEYQPEIEILKSDWIIEWTKSEKGKKISVAKDISTEKYLKSHPD